MDGGRYEKIQSGFSRLLLAGGLAVSGGAHPQKQLPPNNILDEGKILMTSFSEAYPTVSHQFTVAYGRSIYLCLTVFDSYDTRMSFNRAEAGRNPSEHKIL